ncbi:MAG TPA: hypothetical protein VMX16_02455 [Terriglobia bacterium]|nr:hypothetical protein [Terriglobia bacterium]
MRTQIDNCTRNYSTMILLTSLLMFLLSSWANAAQGHLNVGTPHGPGETVEVYVHFPGVFPYGSDSNGNLLVKVTNIKKGDSAEVKAGKIAAAINHGFNTDVATVQHLQNGSWQVNLSYNKTGTLIAGNYSSRGAPKTAKK